MCENIHELLLKHFHKEVTGSALYTESYVEKLPINRILPILISKYIFFNSPLWVLLVEADANVVSLKYALRRTANVRRSEILMKAADQNIGVLS